METIVSSSSTGSNCPWHLYFDFLSILEAHYHKLTLCWHFMGLAYHRLLTYTLGSRTWNSYTCWQQHHALPCRAAVLEEAKKNCMNLYVQLFKNIALTKPLLLLFWERSPQFIDESQDKFTRNTLFGSTVVFLLGVLARNQFYSV